jgi:uncharacterized membrane protein HdeD (DUF308 family)
MKDFFDVQKWNLSRIIRIVMGGLVLFESIRTEQYLLGTIGLLFLIQGVMNFGCGCSVPQNYRMTHPKEKNDEVFFEEIK